VTAQYVLIPQYHVVLVLKGIITIRKEEGYSRYAEIAPIKSVKDQVAYVICVSIKIRQGYTVM
jgi:hypothetical protein